MTIYDSSTKVLLNTSHRLKSFGVNGIILTMKPLHQLDRFSALIIVSLEKMCDMLDVADQILH